MTLSDLKKYKERLNKRNFGEYKPPRNYGKTSVKAPKPSDCRVNSYCYDEKRFYMSDYAVMY